jgi:hypothetical protein
MQRMETLKATLVLTAFGAAVILLCVWTILALRRSKRSLAPVAGMLMLLGAFFAADPPPPPRSETIARDDADEDAGGDPDKVD